MASIDPALRFAHAERKKNARDLAPVLRQSLTEEAVEKLIELLGPNHVLTEALTE